MLCNMLSKYTRKIQGNGHIGGKAYCTSLPHVLWTIRKHIISRLLGTSCHTSPPTFQKENSPTHASQPFFPLNFYSCASDNYLVKIKLYAFKTCFSKFFSKITCKITKFYHQRTQFFVFVFPTSHCHKPNSSIQQCDKKQK